MERASGNAVCVHVQASHPDLLNEGLVHIVLGNVLGKVGFRSVQIAARHSRMYHVETFYASSGKRCLNS